MNVQKHYIDGYRLTIEEVVSAIKGELGTICISPEAIKRCEDSRNQIRIMKLYLEFYRM